MKTKPVGNNVLVEVLSQSNASSVSTANNAEEVMNYGILRAVNMMDYHITASSAILFDKKFQEETKLALIGLVGKVVRWEQYAEGGQTFTEDGKKYALIPWWRLIGYEE